MTIVADDYGMGPETSRAILDLAREGRITAAVLIVNSSDAPRAAEAWRRTLPEADLGWHPNLTLDAPLSPPEEVPSLVRADGTFWPLGTFLARLSLGLIRHRDVQFEWQAQYARFIELTGTAPLLVNSHQHVSLFPRCSSALFQVLQQANVRPYLRRVVERAGVLARVPGARIKRGLLSLLGRRSAQRAAAQGYVGCDWLAGVTDHDSVEDGRFWTRWLNRLGPTGSVEICCHPGYRDDTLWGRDIDSEAGLLRRPRETVLLRTPSFAEACHRAGFVPTRPSQLLTAHR
jgi:predicted glycoside hydrolase/deacetylase ChbG (UPF0249 family)